MRVRGGGGQTQVYSIIVHSADDTGKAPPGWDPSRVLAHVPLWIVAWVIQCVGISVLTPTFSSVLRPPLASSPLDDPTPFFIVKTEAIRRQLSPLPFPPLPYPPLLSPPLPFCGKCVLLSRRVFHKTCNGTLFHDLSLKDHSHQLASRLNYQTVKGKNNNNIIPLFSSPSAVFKGLHWP